MSRSRFLLATLLLLLAFAALGPAKAGPLIANVGTDRARYLPYSTVPIFVHLTNGMDRALVRGTVRLVCTHLGLPVGGCPAQRFRLASGAQLIRVFRWNPPAEDGQGYRVQAQARDSSGRLLDDASTAVDVSSTWTKFPRYGFLSGYPAEPLAASRDTIRRLNDFHLNLLQFYDWQFQHQRPLAGTVSAPAAAWADIARRPTVRQTLLDLLAAARQRDMASMNYNLLYGAWAGYDRDGVDTHWGLWKKDGTQDRLPMPGGWATPDIFLFNPADAAWQRFLFGQEAQVFAAYPFDGWQVDQVGDRGDEYDYQGHPVTVWKTFRPFLLAAKAALHKPLIFNNVGGYGLYDTAAHSGEAAVYVECWEWAGQKTYRDLQTLIGQASAWSGGKAVILAAYMDRSYADRFSSGHPGRFNPPGILLTDAAIFASGGAHIELGDDGRLLDNEYFPNRNLVAAPGLMNTLRQYYDFATAYENLLREGLEPSVNPIVISGAVSSTDAAPNTVWTFAKTGGGVHVLHLINLIGEKNTDWRDDHADYPVPIPQTNLAIKYYGDLGTIGEVRWASPDRAGGVSFSLPFTQGTDKRGSYLQFTVPRLSYWDLVFFRAASSRKAKA